MIELNNPDIIVIMEVFSKSINACEINRNEYKIWGYQCFTGNIQEHSRCSVCAGLCCTNVDLYRSISSN